MNIHLTEPLPFAESFLDFAQAPAFTFPSEQECVDTVSPGTEKKSGSDEFSLPKLDDFPLINTDFWGSTFEPMQEIELPDLQSMFKFESPTKSDPESFPELPLNSTQELGEREPEQPQPVSSGKKNWTAFQMRRGCF